MFEIKSWTDLALKLSALDHSFGVEDALKSKFGLFNLILEANQIVVSENVHASAFSNIAQSRELLKRQLQLITSSRSTILSSGKEINNLPYESAGLLKLYNLRHHCESDFTDNF